ncbi:MAG TPA: terpene cyclase/mutase family protein, partial [Planctomycetota bacterium]|nr:terpene cyclase/mutase family protein [Planctomycetota bacterium]
GGSQATESAVEAALRWLARHQEADGHWDCGKYDGSEKINGDTGNTGLALLAFLGAGYTEKSGIFADNVKRAQDWLMKQQQANGCINAKGSGRIGYNHAIAGLALAEAFGMGKNPEVGKVAQKAVDYSIKEHQCPYSGWRYSPKENPDTSVTGWFVMQLKSAKIAGLTVDGTGFQGATAWLDKVTTKEGNTGYTSPSAGSAAMTAVGMVCRQFMGTPNTDVLLQGGSKQLAAATPVWKDPRNIGSEKGFYYWYYGTLAMFQMGGDKWTKWNEALKPVLLTNQCKGGPMDGSVNDKDGSWDPESWIDKHGGRVFTTACGALTLEVYYRYLPMYSK